jgi:hypothetical protein
VVRDILNLFMRGNQNPVTTRVSGDREMQIREDNPVTLWPNSADMIETETIGPMDYGMVDLYVRAPR